MVTTRRKTYELIPVVLQENSNSSETVIVTPAISRESIFQSSTTNMVTIESLDEQQIRELLTQFSVSIPSTSSLLKRRIVDTIKTNFLSHGDELTNEEINVLTVEDVQNCNPPEWIKSLRNLGVLESELKIILTRIGRDEQTICAVPSEILNNLNLSFSTIINLLSLRTEELPVGSNQPTPQASRPTSPAPSGNFHYDDTHSVRDHCTPQGEPQFKALIDALVASNQRDPKVTEFVKGEDMNAWIKKTVNLLSLEKCDDNTRLRCFRKGLAHELLHLANRVDPLITDYKEYIATLKKQLTMPTIVAHDAYKLKNYVYDYSEAPQIFIDRLKDLMEKVKGRMTQEGFLFDLLAVHLPEELVREINTAGINNDEPKIINCLLRHYYAKLEQRKKAKAERYFEKKGNSSSQSFPFKSRDKGTTRTKETAINRYKGLTCHVCKEKDHIATNCPNKRKVWEEKNKTTNNDAKKPQPINTLIESIPSSTYGLSAQIVSDTAEHEINYTLSNYHDIPILTNKGDPLFDYMSLCTLKIESPIKQPLMTFRVLVDTGATSSVIDYNLALKCNVNIIRGNTPIYGITGTQSSIGFAYAILHHPEISGTRIIRLTIVNNFDPVFLLGNSFIQLFYMQINADGKYTKVYAREKPTSKLLDPTFKFRFLTSDETNTILNKPFEKSHNRESLKQLPHHEESLIQSSKIEVDKSSDEANAFTDRINEITKIERIYFLDENLSFLSRLKSRINPELSRDKSDDLIKLFLSYEFIFSKNKKDLGYVPNDICPVEINIGDNIIPYQKPYACNNEKRLAYKKVIADLMEADIIEESTADGGSPALLVPRPDGSNRLVSDFRLLNRLTKVNSFPMPRIDDCLETLRGSKFFNMFDLCQGYHQIALPIKEREKTVFLTPDGKYQYKRLPMGLAGAPFIFQHLINKVLGDLQYTKCLGYFDDVPVMGRTWEELMEMTEKVIKRFAEYNLKVKLEKCKFGYEEILLLGHVVNGKGIKPDPRKVEAIKQLPYPKTVKQLQSLLGCYNYFSRYIQNFSKIAAPLYRLISRERKFKMLDEDKKALDLLKDSLITKTMLVHFDPDLRRKISVDASDIAVGGILLQEDPDSPYYSRETQIENIQHWQPIAFFSQKLLKHQLHYSVSEKELLAVLVGIEKYKHYIEGEQFVVETDHHALCTITKVNFKNARLRRWSIMLSMYNIKIVYKKGLTHPPDCLSRVQETWNMKDIIDPEDDYLDKVFLSIDLQNSCKINIILEDDYYDRGLNIVNFGLDNPSFDLYNPPNIVYTLTAEEVKEKLKIFQKQDPDCQEIIRLLLRKDEKTLRRYKIKDDILYRRFSSLEFFIF